MQDVEILDRIKNVIARVTGLEVEEIGENDTFEEDLSLDSLSLLEIWVEIDREFMSSKVKIPNEEIPDIKTPGEAVSRIQLELAKA